MRQNGPIPVDWGLLWKCSWERLPPLLPSASRFWKYHRKGLLGRPLHLSERVDRVLV